jgi:hypothetical protein
MGLPPVMDYLGGEVLNNLGACNARDACDYRSRCTPSQWSFGSLRPVTARLLLRRIQAGCFLLLSYGLCAPAPQRQPAPPASGMPILSGAPASLISSRDRRTLAPTALSTAPSGTSERARQQAKNNGERVRCWSLQGPDTTTATKEQRS